MKLNLETLMAAVTFAEANQHETALQMMANDNQKRPEDSLKNRKYQSIKKHSENRPTLS